MTTSLGAILKKLDKTVNVKGKGDLRKLVFPAENTRTMQLPPMMNFGVPGEAYLMWVFATDLDADEYVALLNSGKRKVWTFPVGGLLSRHRNPIGDIWLRSMHPPRGAIAHFRYGVVSNYPSAGLNTLYIDMMSVNPKWQRRGLNTSLLLMLLKRYEKLKPRLMFSKTTHAGQAFAEAWRRMGYEVIVEGEDEPRGEIQLTVEDA